MRFILPLFSLLFAAGAFGQIAAPLAEPLPKQTYQSLDESFKNYELFSFRPSELEKKKTPGESLSFRLEMGKQRSWDMVLEPRQIFAPDAMYSVATDNGFEFFPAPKDQHYIGYLKGKADSKVTLTLAGDFFLAMIEEGDDVVFVEPLRIMKEDAPMHHYIVYDTDDVIENKNHSCGFDAVQHKGEEILDQGQSGSQKMMAECVEAEIALAADFSMNTKYGGPSGAGAFMGGILNLVQSNYDDEFDKAIIFQAVEVFVPATSGADPWTSSTGAGTLLNSFSNWGNGVGFPVVGNDFDVAQLWTNRNFSGSTIGIAWLTGVCNGNRFNCCQDFSTNSNLLRVLSSHELGHNFGASHDASGSGFIMAPSVNTSNTWSSSSQSVINDRVENRFSCLGSCETAPVADFIADVNSGCATLRVDFDDLSTNNPTEWQWVFPGGTPSFSTQQNPTVRYDQPGIYEVTLTAINAVGEGTTTKTDYIEVKGTPDVDVTYTTQLNIATFFNLTEDAFAYFWDFGDGRFSQEEEPEHTYRDQGLYFVTVQATNECGTSTETLVVEIFTPIIPDFTTEPRVTSVCEGETIRFINESRGSYDDVEWTFEGGNPSTSLLENPEVTYDEPGIYDVTLKITGPIAEETLVFTDYIEVKGNPTGDFTFSKAGLTVSFESSTVGNSYSWDFGDGTTGTGRNPEHTYASNGIYNVTLNVSDECGSGNMSKPVDTNTSITFSESSKVITEASGAGTQDCREFVEIPISIEPTGLIAGQAVLVDVESSGTALEGVDYELVNTPLTFPAGSDAPQDLIIRVFDDGTLEPTESIRLELMVSGNANVGLGLFSVMDIELDDDDLEIALTQDFELGSKPAKWNTSTKGDKGWEFKTIGEFNMGGGMTIPGNPSDLIAGIDAAACNCDNSRDWLITEQFSIGQLVEGKLTFDAYFPGTQGSTAQVRLNVKFGRTYDVATLTADPSGWQQVEIPLDFFLGQTAVRLIFQHSDEGNVGDGLFVDNIRINGIGGQPNVAREIEAEGEAYVGPFSTVYFFDNELGRVLARIENQTDFDYGCTSVRLDRFGSSAAAFDNSDPATYVTDKTWLITPERNNPDGVYNLTLFYREFNLRDWEDVTGNTIDQLQVVQSDGAISNVNPLNPDANGENRVAADNVVGSLGPVSVSVSGNLIGPFGGYTAGYTEGFNQGNALASTEDSILEAFPNPAGNAIHLLLPDTDEEQGLNIDIFDANARLVYSNTAIAGNTETVNLSDFAQGVYLARVMNKDGKMWTTKFTKK